MICINTTIAFLQLQAVAVQLYRAADPGLKSPGLLLQLAQLLLVDAALERGQEQARREPEAARQDLARQAALLRRQHRREAAVPRILRQVPLGKRLDKHSLSKFGTNLYKFKAILSKSVSDPTDER